MLQVLQAAQTTQAAANHAAALARDGHVRATALAALMLGESRFAALCNFLAKTFGEENVLLMERRSDFVRFKLRGGGEQLQLAKVFERIEHVKQPMFIREYSVSQTTLEQIFNQFASKQAEEKGVARGLLTAA